MRHQLKISKVNLSYDIVGNIYGECFQNFRLERMYIWVGCAFRSAECQTELRSRNLQFAVVVTN